MIRFQAPGRFAAGKCAGNPGVTGICTARQIEPRYSSAVADFYGIEES
jgi:hypothetical protein